MMHTKSIAASALAALLFTLGTSDRSYAADISIPRTNVHFKCKFPDGSYTEFKEIEQWFFWAEIIPHAQTSGSSSSTMKYVDSKGKTHKNVGTRDETCVGVGKRNGRIFFDGGFENLKGELVHFNPPSQIKGVISPRWEVFPKEIPGSPSQTPEIRSFMLKEALYGHISLIIPLSTDQSLLFEQPLTALNHPSIPFNTVQYVYQSISTDYGKTWPPPSSPKMPSSLK
jgi:hypothetical protein